MNARKLMPSVVRGASTVGGAAILHHEIWVTESAEPLLVFVGLWLAGAPIADLLDKLRRLASTAPEASIPGTEPIEGEAPIQPERRAAP